MGARENRAARPRRRPPRSRTWRSARASAGSPGRSPPCPRRGRDGDLFGAVRCPSRPGLPTRILDRVTVSLVPPAARSRTPARQIAVPTDPPAAASATPGGRAVVAEHLAQHAGPFARAGAGLCSLDRRRHDRALVTRDFGELLQGRIHRALLGLRALHSSTAAIRSRSTSRSGVRTPPSSPVVRGDSSVLGELVASDLASLDLAMRLRFDSTSCSYVRASPPRPRPSAQSSPSQPWLLRPARRRAPP